MYINDERYVEDDDFEVDLEFLEIGYNIDFIVEFILNEKEFDEMFKKFLKEYVNRVKF